MSKSITEVITNGVFRENVAYVQLLGLCPLLAVSNTVANAIGLAAASSFVLIMSSLLVSIFRRFIVSNYRLPTFVLIVGSMTSVVTLLMEAFTFPLYARVALFVQIIVTNCMILGRIETISSKSNVTTSLVDAIATSLGFALALITLGGIREILGYFVPLASLPAGSFIVAGILLASGNYLVSQFRKSQLYE
ncbi:MAG: electron transport complex subunit RsxE [Pseudomonadales bacterium]|nr:electron transport complex subunit RsxE [Pseudomonadales bacterium]